MAVDNTGSNKLINAMMPFLGASNTRMSDINQGALQNLVSAFTPQRKPIDPALITLIASAKIAEESSKPGATALGAIGSGVSTGAQLKLADDMQLRKEQGR